MAKRVFRQQRIATEKPTSRYLSACPDLDYFRFADQLPSDEAIPGL
jgi:hypothetical protein